MFQKSTVIEEIHVVKKCTIKGWKWRWPLLMWHFFTVWLDCIYSPGQSIFGKLRIKTDLLEDNGKKINFTEYRISLYFFFFYTLNFSKETLFFSLHLYTGNVTKHYLGITFFVHKTDQTPLQKINSVCQRWHLFVCILDSSTKKKGLQTGTNSSNSLNTDTLH